MTPTTPPSAPDAPPGPWRVAELEEQHNARVNRQREDDLRRAGDADGLAPPALPATPTEAPP